MVAHTAKLLCVCIDYVADEAAGRGIVQVLNNYPVIGEAAYGRRGWLFVELILQVDLVANSTLLLVFRRQPRGPVARAALDVSMDRR